MAQSSLKKFKKLNIVFLLILSFSKLFSQEANLPIEESLNVEEDDKKNDNLFIKVISFIHNLPFGFDLGCEPTNNGSITYFNLRYNWTADEWLSSKFLFNYGSSLYTDKDNEVTVSENYVFYNRKDTAFDFKIVPLAYKFKSKKNNSSYFTLEPGLNYRYEMVDLHYGYPYLDLFNENMRYRDCEQNQYTNIFRPYFSGTLYTPVGSFFSAHLEVLYAPIYFGWLNTDINYRSYSYNDSAIRTAGYKMSYNDFAFSDNYLDVTIMFGFFNMLATSFRFTYNRIHQNDVSQNNIQPDKTEYTDKDFTKDENIYETLNLKLGLSLINIGKSDIRLKTGVFYEWKWRKNHNLDTMVRDGRWVFGVGMRNLY
ncbi:hypothetical protein [Treponema sp. C6A8]|uniref:hypothetical protein n=1 Tax=Treponema sp. C6A8 TaxID=1410609 RepID=UPI0004846615|nr:hypothetical protein [Treponema sp. C6A8]